MPEKWTEGWVHLAMRKILRDKGWSLIAGEFPGGSDHELSPLNVVDPALARDRSPDPRRHSLGELIPDIIALRGRFLLIGEAKVDYNAGDEEKLNHLTCARKEDFLTALNKFALERDKLDLFPLETLVFLPALIFVGGGKYPSPAEGFSYLLLNSHADGTFVGAAAVC